MFAGLGAFGSPGSALPRSAGVARLRASATSDQHIAARYTWRNAATISSLDAERALERERDDRERDAVPREREQHADRAAEQRHHCALEQERCADAQAAEAE